MKLSWLNHGFICNELYAPFVLEKDIDYYKKKILEAIRAYYKADIAKSNNMVL